MTLALMLKGLGTSYLQGAFMGYNLVNGPARANNVNIGDFRRLQVQMASNLAASLEINDLKDLEKQMREIAPAMYHKFRRDQRKLGEPAKDAVQRTFKNVNQNGPLKLSLIHI